MKRVTGIVRIKGARHFAVAGAFALCLTSCVFPGGSPRTEEQVTEAWAKLHVGMTKADVTSILGESLNIHSEAHGVAGTNDLVGAVGKESWSYPFGSVTFEGDWLKETLVSWSREPK